MLEKLRTVMDWQELKRDDARAGQIVIETLRKLGSSSASFEIIQTGSCLNAITSEGFLKIFSPFEHEVETRELTALKRFDSVDLVPKLLARGTTCELQFALLEPVGGERLDTVWDGLDSTQREIIVKQVGALAQQFAKASSKDWPLPNAGAWWLRNRANLKLTQLNPQVAERVLAAGPPSSSQLVHADLKREHLFVDGSKLVGCVDFGDTELGWPEYEAVTVALEVCGRNACLFDAYQRGLGTVLELNEVVASAVGHRFNYFAHFVPEAMLAGSVDELFKTFFA